MRIRIGVNALVKDKVGLGELCDVYGVLGSSELVQHLNGV